MRQYSVLLAFVVQEAFRSLLHVHRQSAAWQPCEETSCPKCPVINETEIARQCAAACQEAQPSLGYLVAWAAGGAAAEAAGQVARRHSQAKNVEKVDGEEIQPHGGEGVQHRRRGGGVVR